MTGVQIWPGAAQPQHTLVRMKAMVLHDYEHSSVVETAVDIADEVDGKDAAAMAEALLVWLRVHTRFVPDPVQQQRLNSPLYMLAKIKAHDKVGGDCADLAMLGGALAMAVGLAVKFVAESYAEPCNPATSPLVHVYTVVQTRRGWLALDTQQPPDGTPLKPCRRVEVALP